MLMSPIRLKLQTSNLTCVFPGTVRTWPLTRKPSCRWQTRATLAKSLHGLRKSNGVVSCIARLPIDSMPMVSYYVTVSVKCVALEILAFENYRDLETRVTGHSRSSKVTPFDSLHMVSYYRPIVTLCLKCTVFAQYRHVTDVRTDRHVAVAKTALS